MIQKLLKEYSNNVNDIYKNIQEYKPNKNMNNK